MSASDANPERNLPRKLRRKRKKCVENKAKSVRVRSASPRSSRARCVMVVATRVRTGRHDTTPLITRASLAWATLRLVALMDLQRQSRH